MQVKAASFKKKLSMQPEHCVVATKQEAQGATQRVQKLSSATKMKTSFDLQTLLMMIWLSSGLRVKR